MATKTKAPLRTGAGKGGRRPPVRVKKGNDVPLLAIAVAAILVVFAIGLIIYFLANNKSTAPALAAGIPCDQLEHTQIHYHAALQIVYQGNLLPIPPNIGISGDPTAPTCFYWLHVHPANTDVIHIESPATDTFTLGQFFAVWSTWNKAQGLPNEPLNATHVSTLTLTPDEKLVVYIDLQDGKGPQVYTGDPNAIVLKSHEVITLEITPPAVTPPPPFTFASGL
ncbi:MAG TPA: hypothetical protein VNU27_09390 [Candidatus Acidoferrum sp.]|jgi:hypothetical protein|nr:hypothetical protein [Candidatus Angelobacter sp.]HXD81771.1 hypothetical protein [Candidatus Acidoferrum sp.]